LIDDYLRIQPWSVQARPFALLQAWLQWPVPIMCVQSEYLQLPGSCLLWLMMKVVIAGQVQLFPPQVMIFLSEIPLISLVLTPVVLKAVML
jgi:hypothetical protein